MDQEGDDAPLGSGIEGLEDLAHALRQLRRRHAREHNDTELSYRELAAKSGYAHGVIGDYFTGKRLPPTDRLDVLVDLLGATGKEKRAFAIARDHIEEHRRRPRAAVPRQLPAATPHFAGRSTEMTTLTGLARAAQAGRTTMVAVIGGMAGVGKTTLAVHWAHQIADQFPDGQLYVNLRGFDAAGRPMDPAEAVRGFLEALDVPPQRIPADPDTRAALYRSTLAGRRILIVLDNAWDSAQVHSLLPGTPGCLVLITSRNQLSGLVANCAQPIDLDVLTPNDAEELLAQRLGPGRLAAEPAAVREIITHCAQLPLALAIVAARAATHPLFPLHALAAELRDASGRLNVLAGKDPTTNMRAVFSWSCRAVKPAAFRLFRLLSLHSGPHLSPAAAASLAGLPLSQVRPLLSELASAHLITEIAPGRYAIHDLLRAYAVEQAEAADPETCRQMAVRRVLDHYLYTAWAAARQIDPARDPLTLPPPQADVTPEILTDRRAALAWFTTELPVLTAVIDLAAEAGLDTHVWQLAWSLWAFLYRQGHWHEQVALQHAAIAAAQRLNDQQAQIFAHRGLADAYAELGMFDEADIYFRHALDLSIQTDDPVGQALTLIGLGYMQERQGLYAEALGSSCQALGLYEAAGHQQGRARVLSIVGWLHALLGDYEQTLAACDQALKLLQELGDRYAQAATWDSLGYAHHHLGHQDQAIACYQQALTLYADIGARYGEANTLTRLGDLHHHVGRPGDARSSWLHALTILDGLGKPDATQVRAKLAALDVQPG